MKLLIIQQPVGNRGDESAHRGLIGRLLSEFPDIEITVLFFNRPLKDVEEFRVVAPNVIYKTIRIEKPGRYFHPLMCKFSQARKFGLVQLLPSVRRFVGYYKSADYVMCAPGGINMGGFQDWIHILMLNLAKRKRKKIIYFGRSIGPFNENTALSKNFKQQSAELLKYFSYLSLRDESSQKIADDFGVKYFKTIDSAFLSSNIQGEIPQCFKDEINGQKYLVFVPNSLVWHFRYKEFGFDTFYEFWVKFANRLIEEYPDHRIVMLPQTTGHSVGVPDGYIYFTKIKNATTNPQQIYVLDEKYGSDPQQAIIKDADFLIGARYHSVVFAINQNTPFVSLSYEHKMNGLLSILGKEDLQVDIDAIMTSKGKLEEGDIDLIMEKIKSSSRDSSAYESATAIAGKAFDELKNIMVTK